MGKYLIISVLLTLFFLSCTYDRHNETDIPDTFNGHNSVADSLHLNRLDISKTLDMSAMLDSTEILVLDSARKVLDVSDDMSIWLIPVEDIILTSYLLCTVGSNNIVIDAIKLKGTWIENDESGFSDDLQFLRPPLIYLADIGSDTSKQLIIKDRQHIGNVYNAEVYHIFSLEKKIKYVGLHERLSFLPVSKKYLIRHWDMNTSIVEVFLLDSLTVNGDSMKLGQYELAVSSDSLRVTNPIVFVEDYHSMLISTR